MKLVFEKMAELFHDKKISEDDDKENLNIQVKSSKRFSEVPEEEVRKRTCLRSTE